MLDGKRGLLGALATVLEKMNSTFLLKTENPTHLAAVNYSWRPIEVAAQSTRPNITHPSEEVFVLPTFSTAAKVRVTITFVLFISSACFNIIALWTITQKYRKRSHVRILISNLAVADLLVTFIVMPLDAIWNITVQWYAGDLVCRVLMFLKLMAMYASAFVTVVISLDRQSAILNPLGIGDAKKKNKIMLYVAWVLSVLLAVPQLFVFHAVSPSQSATYFIQCATVGSFRAHWQETLYNMFTFSCLFLLPLLIMVLCYARILIEISRKMKKACVSSKEVHLRRSSNNIPKARLRTLKMSVVIVLTFIVCWTPYYLLGIWYWFSPEMLTRERVPPSLSHILFLFGLFNACLDPLIYGLFTIHFRREIRRVCRCSKGTKGQNTASVATGSFRVSTSAVAARKANGAQYGLEVTGLSLQRGKCEQCRRKMAESFL
ncbi:gonadotropin-releasing hormone II receptor [Microcaecilia unicolor]|uniref:Gonadotropin-releasing hormone receptor n=1 Tax=Microcaecilia unicolor TaxID=1415580 RepID=A0A6P7WYS2_9AMPH|nr:gonadotropin-releasing hormone II receptor-like [Microcaecilia unicolor]XP_030043073.1 gonadotropin-releasing hormone II receptor-like [Microcaecilia unicolor]XP_030043074.1 gonadotropin-releasing hormone II receptor-like [Microcaecilia unicolor]